MIGALLLLAPAVAVAQSGGFSLDRLVPSSAGDAFFVVSSPVVEGDRRWFAGAITDFAHTPLVLRSTAAGHEVGQIVSARLNLRLQVALSLASRLLIEVEAPFTLLNRGNSPVSPRGTRFGSPDGLAAGDLRLGGWAHLYRHPRDRLQLALAGALWLPTGRHADYTGDGSVRAMGMAVAGGMVGGRLLWSSNLGFRARGERRWPTTWWPRSFSSPPPPAGSASEAGCCWAPSCGPPARSRDRTDFLGSQRLGRGVAGFSLPRPGDALRHRRGPASPSPWARPTCGWSPAWPMRPDPEPPPAPPPPPAAVSRRLTSDRDGDGIVDGDDACPWCRACGTKTPPRHGCPPDRDDDGIVDGEDACLLAPGVRDPDPKKNGCPPDRDGDGIVDGDDACPRERGPRDPDPAKNGCPTLVRVTEREIVILKRSTSSSTRPGSCRTPPSCWPRSPRC